MSTLFFKTEDIYPYGYGFEAKTIINNYFKVLKDYLGNSTLLHDQQVYNKFLKLKKNWKEDTLFVSSGSVIVSNSSYREIIELGDIAIPWIIEDLKETNAHWFFALEKITGQNPIKKENIGDIDMMKEDWIEWSLKNECL